MEYSPPRRVGTEFRECFLFLFHGIEFWLFSLPQRIQNGISRVPSIFVPQNGIHSCFLFGGRVWNGFREFSVQWNSLNSVGNTH